MSLDIRNQRYLLYSNFFFCKYGQKDHFVTNKTGFYNEKSQDFLSILFYIVHTKKKTTQTRSLQAHLSTLLVTEASFGPH